MTNLSRDEILDNAVKSACNPNHMYFPLSDSKILARPIVTTNTILNLEIPDDSYRKSIVYYHELPHISTLVRTNIKRNLIFEAIKSYLGQEEDKNYIEEYNEKFVQISEVNSFYFQMGWKFTPVNLRIGILEYLSDKRTEIYETLMILDSFIVALIKNTDKILEENALKEAFYTLENSFFLVEKVCGHEKIEDIYNNFINLIYIPREDIPKFKTNQEWSSFLLGYLFFVEENPTQLKLEALGNLANYVNIERDLIFFDEVKQAFQRDTDRKLEEIIFGVLEDFFFQTAILVFEVDDLSSPKESRLIGCEKKDSELLNKTNESDYYFLIEYLKANESLLKKWGEYELLKSFIRFSEKYKDSINLFQDCNKQLCIKKGYCSKKALIYNWFRNVIAKDIAK